MRLLLALLLTAFFTQMLSAQDGENGLCTSSCAISDSWLRV